MTVSQCTHLNDDTEIRVREEDKEEEEYIVISFGYHSNIFLSVDKAKELAECLTSAMLP